MVTAESRSAGLDFGPGPWGLLDTVDNLWMGNSAGPLRYGDLEDALMAATILNERLGYAARILPRTIDPGPLRRRDTLTPRLSAEEAIDRIAGRARPAETKGRV